MKNNDIRFRIGLHEKFIDQYKGDLIDFILNGFKEEMIDYNLIKKLRTGEVRHVCYQVHVMSSDKVEEK